MLHLFVDLDGVIADLVLGVGQLLWGAEYDHEKTLANWPLGKFELSHGFGIEDKIIWGQIDQQGMKFWKSLPRTTLYRQLRLLIESNPDRVSTTILTKPGWSVGAYRGKMSWVGKNCPPQWGFLATRGAKVCPYPSQSMVLIDDCEDNLKSWTESGGSVIRVPRPWNNAHPIADGDQYVLDKLKAMIDVHSPLR
jgi:hypothetical protein